MIYGKNRVPDSVLHDVAIFANRTRVQYGPGKSGGCAATVSRVVVARSSSQDPPNGGQGYVFLEGR